MKKIIALLMVFCMLFAFAGCGSRETSDLEYVKERGKLVVGITVFEPMDFQDKDGNWVGFDAELAKAFADEIGVDAEFQIIEWNNKAMELDGKSIDVVWNGMTLNDEVKAAMDCSNAYFNNAQVVIVKEDSDIASPDDLEGKKIGVQLGTTGDIYAGDIKDATVERYNKGFEAVQALTQDKIDAVVIDGEPAKVFVKENEGLKMLDEAFTEEDYAIAVAKGNDELLDKINTALGELKDSGELDKIVDKYITAE